MEEERDRAEKRQALVDRESGGRFMQKARSVLYVPSLVAFSVFLLACAPWQILLVFAPLGLAYYAIGRFLDRGHGEEDEDDAG